MKSLPGLALIAMLLPAQAASAAPFDVYREALRLRTQAMGADRALDYTTGEFLSQVLADPRSPYSDLVPTPEFLNELWWQDLVDNLALDAADPPAEALHQLQWQTGLTKARPGIEVAVSPEAERSYRGREAAANATKAGVDPDIFMKAWDMNPHITVAAGHAVALQILRTQMEDIATRVARQRGADARPTQSDYDRNAIDPTVVERYLATRSPQQLNDAHLDALAAVLRSALKRPLGRDERGRTQLPAAYRVARVTAAYSDARGNFSPTGYCRNDDVSAAERLVTGHDATDYYRPMCFIGATDRAVHEWFRSMVHADERALRIHENPNHSLSNAARWLTTVLMLADLAPFVEELDAFFMRDLASADLVGEADAELAANRSSQLQCRLMP